MNKWLTTVLIIVVIVIILIFLLAIYPTGCFYSCNPPEREKVFLHQEAIKLSSLKVKFIELANLTCNFFQQVNFSYKGVQYTFVSMNNLALEIEELINSFADNQLKLAILLEQKHEIYKELLEEILVNRKALSADNHLLKHLNEKNSEIAEIMIINGQCNKKIYIEILHKIDIAMVSQLGALCRNDYQAVYNCCSNAKKYYVQLADLITRDCISCYFKTQNINNSAPKDNIESH